MFLPKSSKSVLQVLPKEYWGEGVVRLLTTQKPNNRPGWWRVCFISGVGNWRCGGGGGSRSIPRSPQDLCPYPPHSAQASAHRSSWFQRRPRRTYRMWPGQGGLGQSHPGSRSTLKKAERGPEFPPTRLPFFLAFLCQQLNHFGSLLPT